MKQFKTSTGQDLPKVINWLANKEHERLGYFNYFKDKELLKEAFRWADSKVFGENSDFIWSDISCDKFTRFYEVFPICKNSRGQILPDEIQIEIIEERLKIGRKDESCPITWFFSWEESIKGFDYWDKIYHSDYSTQSDEFTQGEIVEVKDEGDDTWVKRDFYQYHANLENPYLTIHDNKYITNWKYCRKIPPTEYTIDQLIEIVSKAEGKPVKLKV